MFKCELCGGPLTLGLCEACIEALGTEIYAEQLDIAQDNFFAEWSIGECSDDEEVAISAITFGILNAIHEGKSPEDMVRELNNDDIKGLYPMSVGVLESTPCIVCGRWSTGLCCN